MRSVILSLIVLFMICGNVVQANAVKINIPNEYLDYTIDSTDEQQPEINMPALTFSGKVMTFITNPKTINLAFGIGCLYVASQGNRGLKDIAIIGGGCYFIGMAVYKF